MSSIILPSLGAAIGGAVGGPLGASIGQGLGGAIGSEIDNNLFFKNKYKAKIGPKLNEIILQTATYGKMIPIIYGTVKIAGNIIWAGALKENRHDYYQKRSKFSGRELAATCFSYTISIAIAIGEGEISEILRVWANDQLIDPRQNIYRFYNGSEDQKPDPLIEAIEGYGKTPAFRGLSYVVIENLQLAEFGNRLPQFLFEVRRKIKVPSQDAELPLEERIKAMVMIPGSGEFIYDSLVQSKLPKNYNPKFGNFNLQKTKINQNNREGKADALVSLDQLKDTCPNVEWVAPVVSWYTNSISASGAKILPGVEYREGLNSPDNWSVAGFSRDNAHLITRDKYNSPIYGGTSNDASILRYLDELKARGYKIMFYPMVLVDQMHKPWRGRITGTSSGVKDFFYKTDGYNNFIIHYAKLVKGKIDAFIIGSEMIGLTKIRDKNNKFPAVDALIDLAKRVKEILGASVKITYAADWSEYHHTEHGWYNLDPLWACEYIDFVGIDAYFPLSNSSKMFYDEQKIINGWQSGEGYEYYYSDDKKLRKQPLKPAYAWKNIKYWWENEHYNPDGNKTQWQPRAKKIWFTEIGFPSVDLATNQPNVFYAPDSVEGKFPLHSSGNVDFVAQRQALSATEKYWRNSEFLENMFVWTWDARPFPYWPDLNKIWKDGGCWSRGHWVNGKLGLTTLQAVVHDICKRAGLSADKVKAHELTDLVDGIVITSQETAREFLNLLKLAYFFDTHESDNTINFVKKYNRNILNVKKDELVILNNNKPVLSFIKTNEFDLARSFSVHYFNNLFDYQPSIESFSKDCVQTNQVYNLHLPIILNPSYAKNIAVVGMQEMWQGQYLYQFALPPSYLGVKPNDHILLDNILMKVVGVKVVVGRVSKISAISIKQDVYQNYLSESCGKQNILINKEYFDPGNSELVILDLPRMPYEVAPFGVYLGVIGCDAHWRGASVFCFDGSNLLFKDSITAGIIEEEGEDWLILEMFNGELDSVSESEIQRFANIAIIGEEVIQFQKAELIRGAKYKISIIKRKLFGTNFSQDKRFILFDNKLRKHPISDQLIGNSLEFCVTSIGHDETREIKVEFEFKGRSKI